MRRRRGLLAHARSGLLASIASEHLELPWRPLFLAGAPPLLALHAAGPRSPRCYGTAEFLPGLGPAFLSQGELQ